MACPGRVVRILFKCSLLWFTGAHALSKQGVKMDVGTGRSQREGNLAYKEYLKEEDDPSEQELDFEEQHLTKISCKVYSLV